MAQALIFDKKLKQALDDSTRGYTWVQPWRADKRSIVDVAGFEGEGLDGDELEGKTPCVLVEVELKKDNPVENVVKIWHWAADRNRKAKRILFLHAFSAHYQAEGSTLDSSNARIRVPLKTKQHERAVFIGKQMKKDRARHIDYQELPIFTTTRAGKRIQYKPLMRRGSVIKEGGGAMYRAAEILAKDIAKLLHAKSRR
ncbi:MAG TPA: hypothetical protein VE263_22530 [Candidatus Angelobacter sp.]|nr:hypothetical protein [Candidatus Angelobacter sp.]